MVERVIILANDVVPGSGLPVAAPGLRAHGLATGLRSLGYSVTVVVPRHILDRVSQSSSPAPLPDGAIELPGDGIAEYLATNAPATVVFSNHSYIASLEPNPELRYVLDLFAPKMLELAYKFADRHPQQKLARMREAKRKSFELADALIVNGAKKVPYALAWALQTDHDPRSFAIEVVNMAVPGVDHVGSGGSSVRMGIAGYLQGWSLPGPWLSQVTEYLEANPKVGFDVLLPSHWGEKGASQTSPRVDQLVALPNVVSHPVMRFHEFQDHVASLDVVIDLFEHSLEREYAMVTRTVVALACGVPVIHPPFTEVSPFIEQYDAGWLVDADDAEALTKLMSEITPAEAAAKSANAARLHRDVFAPGAATAPLKSLIDGLWPASEPS